LLRNSYIPTLEIGKKIRGTIENKSRKLFQYVLKSSKRFLKGGEKNV